MNRDEAFEQSQKAPPGSRSLRCVWYCGRINDEIRKATRRGETRTEIVFPPRHYVVLHRDLFRDLYLAQGFDVGFQPNFEYIQPTEWRMVISWEKETMNNEK